ncbi:hypothetical protein IWQ61_002910 [Dispira simplex]|nr:hypothetical protein IWQ61_002910 [Dispira simplex]
MNGLMSDGLCHLDCAKAGVEYFIKKRNNHREDKFMLVTYEDGPDSIKAQFRESSCVLLEQLKTVCAYDMFNGGKALGDIFDQLSLYRVIQGMDTFGMGRRPWASEPALILWFTDGRTMLQPNRIADRLNIPGLTTPGADRYCEPFRWDHRLYTIYLDGTGSQQTEPQINLMCDVMGGTTIRVSTLRTLQQSIDTMLGTGKPKDVIPSLPFIAQPNGVLVNFESIRSAPPNDPTTALFNMKNSRRMITLAGSASARNTGFFPIPENYWPDGSAHSPPRRAHPVLLYDPTHSFVHIPPGFPFDKYVVESCPMTQDLLKQPLNTHWPVLVMNSYKNPGVGFPFGFVRANSLHTMVNLYILPYNYPILFTLLEQLKKSPGQALHPKWCKEFADYLERSPVYYLPFLRNALQLYGLAEVSSLQWGQDVQAIVKRQEDTCNAIRADSARLLAMTKKLFWSLKRPLRTGPGGLSQLINNAFDVPRENLLDQLQNMRKVYRRNVVSGTMTRGQPWLDHLEEETNHSKPIAMMGNFQPVMNENIEQELRDPWADEEQLRKIRRTMFGNPYVRLDKRSGLENVNEDMALELNESQDAPPPQPTAPRPRRRLRLRTIGKGSALTMDRKRRLDSLDGGGDTTVPSGQRKWPTRAMDTAEDQIMSSQDISFPELAPKSEESISEFLVELEPKESTAMVEDSVSVELEPIVPEPVTPATQVIEPSVAQAPERIEGFSEETPSETLVVSSRQAIPCSTKPSLSPGSPEPSDIDILSSWKLAMSEVVTTETPKSVPLSLVETKGDLPPPFPDVSTSQPKQHPVPPQSRSTLPYLMGTSGTVPKDGSPTKDKSESTDRTTEMVGGGSKHLFRCATIPVSSGTDRTSGLSSSGSNSQVRPPLLAHSIPLTPGASHSIPALPAQSQRKEPSGNIPLTTGIVSGVGGGGPLRNSGIGLAGHLGLNRVNGAANISSSSSASGKAGGMNGNTSAPGNGMIREPFSKFKQDLLKDLKMDQKNYDERSILRKLGQVEVTHSFSSGQKRSLVNACITIARGLRRRAIVDKLERMNRSFG